MSKGTAFDTKIWIAVCSFLILALAKKKLGLEQLFNKNQNSVSTDKYSNLFSMSLFKRDSSVTN